MTTELDLLAEAFREPPPEKKVIYVPRELAEQWMRDMGRRKFPNSCGGYRVKVVGPSISKQEDNLHWFDMHWFGSHDGGGDGLMCKFE